jgi:hypothetical protein
MGEYRILRVKVSPEMQHALMRMAKSRGVNVSEMIETWIRCALSDDLPAFLMAEATGAAARMLAEGGEVEPPSWKPPAGVVEICLPEDPPVLSVPRRYSARVARTVFASRADAGVMLGG